MRAEKLVLNQVRNVTLTAYLQEVGGEFGFEKRPAMIVLPGGGYAMCSDREADPVALAYLKAGYQAFVLRYTVGRNGKWPDPLNDYEQAYEAITRYAAEWGVDMERIAVAGFSAGGHLAACAATIAEHKPKAAVLVYPAILHDICDLCQTGMPAPNEKVDKDTCPCFLVAAQDDHTVAVKNSLMFELALAELGIPFESHIYSYGGHGFSTGEAWVNTQSVSGRLPDWVGDSIGWLKENLGELTRKGFTEPHIEVSKSGDNAPVLAVNCTLNHIRRQDAAVQELLQPMYDRVRAVAVERGFSEEGLLAAIGDHYIREIMETVQISMEEILEIDKKLHGMINMPDQESHMQHWKG